MTCGRLSILLLLLLLLVALSSSPCRAEETYEILESELTRLDEILQSLEKLNQQWLSNMLESGKNLQLLQEELKASQEELALCKSELEDLRMRLISSESSLESLKSSLEVAQSSSLKLEESFNKYKRETERKIKSLEWQRNISYLVSGLLLLLALGR